MGVRESLLNTITSVADSDFVRIVTSAGASSKATVRNLFKGFESNLSAKSSLTTSDYIRVVGSDNEAYKQSVSDVAKKIIENYTGSSLAGSSQSVKNALDSLNSNLKRKIANYNNITIPASGYVKIDSFATLGVNPSYFLFAMSIRGWSGNDVPKIVKGQNGTDFYAVGTPGTYPSFGVEYYFAVSVDVL